MRHAHSAAGLCRTVCVKISGETLAWVLRRAEMYSEFIIVGPPRADLDVPRRSVDRHLDTITLCDSNLPTIVCPVQQSLPLPRAAKQITGLAVRFDLIDVAAKCLPALDLPFVFVRHPPTHVIAAVPLKPPARIIVMKPAFEAPFR